MSNRAKGRSKTRVEVRGMLGGVREHLRNVTGTTTEMMQRDYCAGLRSLRRREGQLGIRWSWSEPVVGASAGESGKFGSATWKQASKRHIIDLVRRVHTLD